MPPRPETFAMQQSETLPLRTNRYPHARLFPLPPPSHANWSSLSWLDLVAKRRTCRRFKDLGLPAASLGAILYSAYGLMAPLPCSDGGDLVRRPSPSAGATYPLEIYVALNHSDDPPSGLYHYSSSDHALAQLSTHSPAQSLERMCLQGESVSSAPLVMIISAVFGRTTAKYGDRGYRYILLEAGHVAQTIALAAASLGLNTLPIGGFVDDKIDAWIGLDGVNQSACYLIGVGEPVL